MQAATKRSRHSDAKGIRHASTGMLGRNTDSHWSVASGATERDVIAAHAPAAVDLCLSSQQMLAFVDGRLSPRGVSDIDAHMTACHSCAMRVLELLSAQTQAPVSMQTSGAHSLSLSLGACLGERYLVYRMLGQGGMGEVYEALDLELQKPVAIKTIRARACDDPEALERLAGEHALGRRVLHPNVRRTYHFGAHKVAHAIGATFPFISMELIAGSSVATHLRGGHMTFESVVALSRALLAGIAAIHRQGIIHRDIKSHNILLRDEPSGPLAVIDFGLAIDAEHARRGSRGARNRANARWVEGSPAYMAPEQFNAGDAGFASDVFGCGVVLFQMLTGRLPFRSLRTTSRVMRRDPREVPCRVRALAPHLPTWIDAFVRRCVELDGRARYADGSAALMAFEEGLTRCEPPST